MTALIADRNTPVRTGQYTEDPMSAGVKIYAGSLVVLSATGYAQPGTTAVGLIARGRAEEQQDNTTGAAGALSVRTQRGIFEFGNDGTITRANIGATAYIVDDNTLSATNGTNTRSAAGEIVDVDANGVWVHIQ